MINYKEVLEVVKDNSKKNIQNYYNEEEYLNNVILVLEKEKKYYEKMIWEKCHAIENLKKLYDDKKSFYDYSLPLLSFCIAVAVMAFNSKKINHGTLNDNLLNILIKSSISIIIPIIIFQYNKNKLLNKYQEEIDYASQNMRDSDKLFGEKLSQIKMVKKKLQTLKNDIRDNEIEMQVINTLLDLFSGLEKRNLLADNTKKNEMERKRTYGT